MMKIYANYQKPLFWLLMCLVFPALQVSAQLSSKATMGKMFLDADAADWTGIPSDTAKIFTAGGTDPLYKGPSDFLPTFKTAWDSKNFYFYADIKDDIKVKKGTFYLTDNLELSLDVNNSKGAAFDGVDDIKIRINRDTTLVNTAIGNNMLGDYPWTATSADGMKGMVVKQKEVTGGYIVEVAIPWDSIQVKNPTKVTIGEGTTIGFMAYFCDQDSLKDNGADRTKLIAFNGAAGGTPSTWGTLTLTGTPVQTKLTSNAAQGKIIIDADAADWVNAPDVPVAIVNSGANNLVDAADFSGTFKTSWDKKNFYFFANIKDDIKVKKGTFYLTDNFELSLDVNNSKGNAFDGVDDIKIRINRDTTLINTGIGNNILGDYPWTATSADGMKGMVIKQKEVAGGYLVELAIPWDSIQSKVLPANRLTLAENSVIGMQVYFCDQDSLKDNGADRTKLLWINAVGGKPATWGDLMLAGTPVETKLTSNATQVKIVIDGDASEWTNATSVPVAVVNSGAVNLVDAADFSGSFKTAWDAKKMYFYADIKDDIKVKKGTFYLTDNFELSLDLNNSKGNAFDGVDDIKIRINRDTTLVNTAIGNNMLGDYPWTATTADGMKGMAIVQKEVSGGYQVELSIPWDSIQVKNQNKVAIAEGTTFGMQVYFCDQDSLKDNGAHRTKLLWINAVASKPATWGDVVLAGTPVDFSALKTVIDNKYAIYPNPVKDMLYISNVADVTSIQVYELNGKLLNSYRNTTENLMTINTSTYNKGVYLIKINDSKDNVQMSKFVKF